LRRFNSTIARDELRRRAFRTGFSATGREGEEPAVLPLYQRLVEFEQGGRFDEHATLLDPAGGYEQRGEPEDQAIERGEIRGALSAAVTDQKLMFEK
jgi:hypothetical protein